MLKYYRVTSPENTYYIKETIEMNKFTGEISKININLDRCVTISMSSIE
jgi:hypothetical protein